MDISQCSPAEKHLADDGKILLADKEEQTFTDITERSRSLTDKEKIIPFTGDEKVSLAIQRSSGNEKISLIMEMFRSLTMEKPYRSLEMEKKYLW